MTCLLFFSLSLLFCISFANNFPNKNVENGVDHHRIQRSPNPKPRQTSSPSRPAPSRPAPSPSRSAPSRPSATSRPATSRPATNRPAPTYRTPAPSYRTQAPTYRTPAPSYRTPAPSYRTPAPTYRTPAPTYRTPAPTYRTPAPSPTYRTVQATTHRQPTGPPTTHRAIITQKSVVTFSSPSSQKPWTTPRQITTQRPVFTSHKYPSPPPITQGWQTPKTTWKMPTQHWTTAPYRPPTRPPYQPPRPYDPYQNTNVAPGWKTNANVPIVAKPGGIGGLIKGLFSGSSHAGPKPSSSSSKMAMAKKLATALYGVYKGRKLKKRVSHQSYKSYSPYYGRDYYYGRRYYPAHTSSRRRLLCHYIVPQNDQNFDLYYEDNSPVQEIVYECDADRERCCGSLDCCRGSSVVNARGSYVGQRVTDDGIYQEEAMQTQNQQQELFTDARNPDTTFTPEIFNFENLSDDDFLAFNDTLISDETDREYYNSAVANITDIIEATKEFLNEFYDENDG